MSEENKTVVVGYVKKGKLKNSDPYLSPAKATKLEVNGKEYSSFGVSRFLTVYDKDKKQEVIVGKIVKRPTTVKDENGDAKLDSDGNEVKVINTWVNFKPGLKVNGTAAPTNANYNSSSDKIKRIEKDLLDGKISEGEAEERKKYAGYSMGTITFKKK